MSFVQSRLALRSSHVGHDATLVETHKQQALYSYKKYKAYQPLIWAEAEDSARVSGRQRTCWLSATASVDRSVGASALCGDKVMLRSDAAGYQHELLRYCAEGKRFGVIEFAVGLN